MIVDEISGEAENFPVGMRVLAVDDDPICLKLLDTLLRKCQYRVTTTCQARVALKTLRENKDQFDLVISDVHMPDMDGFKLLELVGIEMDLPVIMLSANSDPKLVMEGVTHGACDYLVKPVRIEELRNIWQHVVRRKNFDAKTQNKSGCRDNNHPATDRRQSSLAGNSDHNGKFNRKRKDEEEESEDNGNDSEDPAMQKKPRVVWSVDLHRKFVAAVNQLGIDKAVPKRILDLMNVDGLTRENVASHLQKYRLYLRRISSVATQQTNMAAGIGVKDSPFMHMGSLDRLGGISSGARHANVGLPFTTSMLSRLNSPANVNLRSLASSALVQESRAQNLSNSISSLGRMPPLLSPPSQNASSLQGISSALELDQFSQNWGATVDNSRLISNVGMFTNLGTAIGSSSNLLNNASNNGIMQNGKAQQAFSGGGFGNQSARTIASFTSGSFNGGVSTLSSSLDPGKYNQNWQNNIESSKMPPNPSHSSGPFRGQLPLNGWRDNSSSNGPYVHNSVVELTSSMALLPFEDSREIQCQEELVGDLQNMHQAPGQRSGENGPNYAHDSNNTFVSLASPIPPSGTVSPLGQGSVRNSTIFNQKMDAFTNGRSSGSASTLVQQKDNELSATESRERSNEDFLLEQPKLQSGFVPLSYDSSLDELVNARIKREQGETIPACDFGFDDYPFGPGV